MVKKTKVLIIVTLSILIALFVGLTALGIVLVVTGFVQNNSSKYIQGFVYIPVGMIFTMFIIIVLVLVSKKHIKYWKN